MDLMHLAKLAGVQLTEGQIQEWGHYQDFASEPVALKNRVAQLRGRILRAKEIGLETSAWEHKLARLESELAGEKHDLAMQENVENDYGHREDTNTTKLIPYKVRDYDFAGRGNYPQHLVNRQGDNPMQRSAEDGEGVEITIEEGMTECEGNPQADALHMMLNKADVPDEMIANGAVQLTAAGRSKIIKKLGEVNIDVLLAELAQKMNGADEAFAQDYHASVNGVTEDDDEENEDPAECPACYGPGVPLGVLGNREHFRCRNCGKDFSRSHWFDRQMDHYDELDESPYEFDGDTQSLETDDSTPGRFSYETDYMGNITIRDSQSNGQLFMQGDEAHQLISQLEAVENDDDQVQQILSQYEGQLQQPLDLTGMGESVAEAVRSDEQGKEPMSYYVIEHKTSRNGAWHQSRHNRTAYATEEEAIEHARMHDEDGIWPIPNVRVRRITEGDMTGNYIDGFNGGESVEENEMGELIGEGDGTEYFMATLERPVPNSIDDDWDNRPVKVYYEYDAGERGSHGEFGRPMDPSEDASCSIWKVVDAETGQEYEIDNAERQHLQELCMRELTDHY